MLKNSTTEDLGHSTWAEKNVISGINLTYLGHLKKQMSSLNLPSVVTEKVMHTQGFRQPHTLSRAERTSTWSTYLSSSFQKKLDCWNAKEGQTAEDAAAAKVTSLSLLIHVNSTASLLARENTCFSEILSSLFVRIKSCSASLCLWKQKSLEQTAVLTSASTDPFVKAASKVATLHHMLYWGL